MFITIPTQSQRVSLRPFEESDIQLWNVWDNDPKVQEYMSEPHEPLSIEEQAEYLNECKNAEDEIHASIVDLEHNVTIGTISLTQISFYHGIGELGIVIGNTSYHSKGYGFQAMQLFVNYLKNETDLVRISAE